MKLLTVAALRTELIGLPDDAIILADGCDCLGAAGYVKFEPRSQANGFDTVTICRHPEYDGGDYPETQAEFEKDLRQAELRALRP